MSSSTKPRNENKGKAGYDGSSDIATQDGTLTGGVVDRRMLLEDLTKL